MKPDIVSYNALISACEKGKDSPTALHFWEDMQSQGIKPDVATHNALISACEKEQHLPKASSLMLSPTPL